MDIIFETNFTFHEKLCSTGKVQVLFFRSFLVALARVLFWKEERALGYNSKTF